MEFKVYCHRFNHGTYVVGEESIPTTHIVSEKYPAIFIGVYGPEKTWIMDGSSFWIEWYETKNPSELHFVYETLGSRKKVEEMLDKMISDEIAGSIGG